MEILLERLVMTLISKTDIIPHARLKYTRENIEKTEEEIVVSLYIERSVVAGLTTPISQSKKEATDKLIKALKLILEQLERR